MNNLQLALQITGVGMGLVFGAIIMLWGLMYFMTVLSWGREPSQAGGQSAQSAGNPTERDLLKARAAAAAVALALAEQDSSSAHPLPPPPTSIVSAWQLGMRTRQMHQKGSFYKKEKR